MRTPSVMWADTVQFNEDNLNSFSFYAGKLDSPWNKRRKYLTSFIFRITVLAHACPAIMQCRLCCPFLLEELKLR